MEEKKYSRIHELLEQIGLQKKQAAIFLATLEYGPKPASTIAQLCSTERSYTYKTLEKMLDMQLVQQIQSQWVKHYYIENIDVIDRYITRQEQQFGGLHDLYEESKQDLHELTQRTSPYIPKISQFSWVDGISNRYTDMINEIAEQNVLMITSMITHLFDSHVTQFRTLHDRYQEFLEQLTNVWVHKQTIVGNGSLVIESFAKMTSRQAWVVVWNQSIQLWIVGDCLYIGLFREIPYGLKMKSLDMVNLLQSMIDKLQTV